MIKLISRRVWGNAHLQVNARVIQCIYLYSLQFPYEDPAQTNIGLLFLASEKYWSFFLASEKYWSFNLGFLVSTWLINIQSSHP